MDILRYFHAKLSILPRVFSPTTAVLFSSIPWNLRWRILFLQPINLIATLLTTPQWVLNNRYSVLYIPTRAGSQRALLYSPLKYTRLETRDGGSNNKRPLHINIHGGGWIGGIAEQDSRWCTYLSDKTGSIVVSITYRIAPRWLFPTAHEDVQDVASWIISNAESKWNADLNAVTVSGASVGGALALSLGKEIRGVASDDRKVEIKGYIGFCPLFSSLRVVEKPKPPGFPDNDPMSFVYPLFDAYAEEERKKGEITDKRLNLVLLGMHEVPKRMLVVIAGLDVLAKEQLDLVEKLRGEIQTSGDQGRKVETMFFEKGFHGFLELPKFVMEKERLEVFNTSVEFISDIHKNCDIP